MATTVTVPTVADLPKDWKSTAFGVLTAIATLLTQYVQTGAVTWPVALAAVAVAVICYFIPAKVPTATKLDIAAEVAKIAADIIAKQTTAVIISDAEALAATIEKTVLATLSAQKAIQAPALTPEDGTTGNLGAATGVK